MVRVVEVPMAENRLGCVFVADDVEVVRGGRFRSVVVFGAEEVKRNALPPAAGWVDAIRRSGCRRFSKIGAAAVPSARVNASVMMPAPSARYDSWRSYLSTGRWRSRRSSYSSSIGSHRFTPASSAGRDRSGEQSRREGVTVNFRGDVTEQAVTTHRKDVAALQR
jgi:hypothetical protein